MVVVDKLCYKVIARAIFSGAWKRGHWREPIKILYFESCASGVTIGRLLCRSKLVSVEQFVYDLCHFRDASDAWILPRVASEDSTAVISAIFESEVDVLMTRLGRRSDGARLRVYFQKAIGEEVYPSLIKINLIVSELVALGSSGDAAYFFLARSVWSDALTRYAAARNIAVKTYCHWGGEGTRVLPKLLSAGRKLLSALGRVRLVSVKAKGESQITRRGGAEPARKVRIALPCAGNGVSLDLSRNTDMFWVAYAKRHHDDVLAYFYRNDDALDEDKMAELRRAGIGAAVLDSSSGRAEGVAHWQRGGGSSMASIRFGLQAARDLMSCLPIRPALVMWSLRQLAGYSGSYHYWRDLFSSYSIGVHVAYYDASPDRVAADQAIDDLGGVSVSFQRSEEYPSFYFASSPHVHFGFRNESALVEQASGSHIEQMVCAGYIHDHAFTLVKDRAAQIRSSLAESGATFVICFLDENSTPDSRLGASHEHAAHNYLFLLDQLIRDEGLGLVVKPKKAGAMHARMEPHRDLWNSAMATGRMAVIEDGTVATQTLPCEAGLAADVTIALLVGGTAAFETRLAGRPTVLLDREHYFDHRFQALGRGRVIFRDWSELWPELLNFRRDPIGYSEFGDWGHLIEELEPFRDGRAAERMGDYIGKIARGLSGGLSRDEVLRMVRTDYVSTWGKDKIRDVGITRAAPNSSVISAPSDPVCHALDRVR